MYCSCPLFEFIRFLNAPFLQVVVVTCERDLQLPFILNSPVLQVVVVTCERDLQLQRLIETRHLSERESILLIDTQMAQEDKAARACYVVENSGNQEDLRQQILAIHQVTIFFCPL